MGLRFGAVDGQEEKAQIARAHGHVLLDLGSDGRDVETLWARTTGRTEAAQRWLDLLEAFLTRPSDWNKQDRDQVWQDRNVTTIADRQDDDERDEQTDPMTFQGPRAITADWKAARKIIAIGSGGEGKSWWVERLIVGDAVDADGVAFPSIAAMRRRLQTTLPTDLPLPLWLGPPIFAHGDRGDDPAFKISDISASEAVRKQLVERSVRYVKAKVLDDEQADGALRDLWDEERSEEAQDLFQSVCSLLHEQFATRRRHSSTVVLDAAERVPDPVIQHVFHTTGSSGDNTGWVIASTRPHAWVANLVDRRQQSFRDEVAKVRLSPLQQRDIRDLVASVRGGRSADENERVTDLVMRLPGASTPLIVTLAARLEEEDLDLPDENPEEAIENLGVAPVLERAIAKLMSERYDKEYREQFGVAGYQIEEEEFFAAQILGRLGVLLLLGVGEERTHENPGPSLRIRVRSKHLFVEALEIEKGKVWTLLNGLLVDCGLLQKSYSVGRTDTEVRKARRTWEFGNDVIRDFAVACAMAHDPMFDPGHPRYAELLGAEPDDEQPGALRDYLNLDPSVVMFTASYAGEMLNEQLGAENLPADERERIERRLEELFIRLSRPTPLSELPHDVRPGLWD